MASNEMPYFVEQAMGHGEGAAGLTIRKAAALADVFEEVFDGLCMRSACPCAPREKPALIIAAADEDFLPRAGLDREEFVAFGELVDVGSGEVAEEGLGELIEGFAALAIARLEVAEQEQ